MLSLILTFWKPLAIILVVITLAVAVGVAKHGYDERRRDEGRSEIQAKWDADIQLRIAKTAEIERARDAERDRADKAGTALALERTARAKSSAVAATNLAAAVRDVHVPAAAVGLLNDTIRAGNADPSAAPGKPVEGAPTAAGDSDLGKVIDWGVACSTQYASCRDQVGGLIDFYNHLREVQ